MAGRPGETLRFLSSYSMGKNGFSAARKASKCLQRAFERRESGRYDESSTANSEGVSFGNDGDYSRQYFLERS